MLKYGRRRHGHEGIICEMDKKSRSRARREMGKSAYRRIEPRLNCRLILALDQETIITVCHRNSRYRYG